MAVIGFTLVKVRSETIRTNRIADHQELFEVQSTSALKRHTKFKQPKQTINHVDMLVLMVPVKTYYSHQEMTQLPEHA